MTPEQARRIWLGFWRAMARWNRYEVTGFEHLRLGRAALLVGYHGRPVAFDLCMLSVEVHERLGYLPHGIMHGALGRSAALQGFIDGLGFVTGDGPAIRAAVDRGEHIVTLPGGTREGMRSVRHRYRVDWGGRRGYVRLAARYGLPIVPVASSGVDDAYLGLVDGYRLGRRVGLPHGIPLWVGVGPLGLWPLSPPFPVPMRQLIGAPIWDTADLDPGDGDAIERVHRRVAAEVQALLDRARGVTP